MTATYPTGQFGAIEKQGQSVTGFVEKPRGDGGLINAGFFVLDPAVLDFINTDATVWEQEPLQALATQGELMAYEHFGFGNLWIPSGINRSWRLYGYLVMRIEDVVVTVTKVLVGKTSSFNRAYRF